MGRSWSYILVRVSCVRTHTDTLSHAHRLPWRLLVCVLLPPGVSSRTGKTRGGAGTHTATRDTHGTGTAGTHTGHAGAQRHTDHADEPHNHPNPPTTHIPHVSATTEAAADSTATGPEPTAPRGRLSTCTDVQYTSGMLVRFVCVIRVPVCARVSRVFPG